MRLDKWLWVARFFKTRSLAQAAVEGGKVRINGASAKPAKEIVPGVSLEIRSGEQMFVVEVKGCCEQRRPAPEARLLYEETPESVAERARLAELQRLAPMPVADHKGRPTKRDRRALERFRG